MPVGSAREVAVSVVHRVLAENAYANLLLPGEITKARLDPRDAALATEICYGTLRKLGFYEQIIESQLRKGNKELSAKVSAILLTGTHQILAMRVPDHAAVSEAVDIAKKMQPAASGLVNAVLRKVLAKTEDEWTIQLGIAKEGIISAHPAWIVEAFKGALKISGQSDSEEDLQALLDADNLAPAVDIAILGGENKLESLRYSPIGGRWPGGPIQNNAQILAGNWRVQDQGSQLVALALAKVDSVSSGEKWLDMCAAPGGKTAILASASEFDGVEITANEIHEARSALMKKSLQNFENLKFTTKDGTFFEDIPETFDRILLDAPCSGLGSLRRRPESRWRKKPSDLPNLRGTQEKLLNAALTALKPGGYLAYVTCSPHLAETKLQVERVSDRVKFLDSRTELNKIAREPLFAETGVGPAWLWPHIHGTDAMFISLMQKL